MNAETQMLKRADIAARLPHGEGAVAIDELTLTSSRTLEALSKIGMCMSVLDGAGRMLPESALEMAVQAAAVGTALAQEPGQAVQKGVIAHLRTFKSDRNVRPIIGDEVIVSVRWSALAGAAVDVEGSLRLKDSNVPFAELTCMVIAIS